MADYTALMEAGSALVEMLRDNLTPEPLSDRELIALASPHESENSQLTVYLYHVEEDSPNPTSGYYQADRDLQRVRPARYTLRYLVTAHSKAPAHMKEAEQHRILGAALQVLRDNPIIPQQYLSGSMAEEQSELHLLVERVPLEQILKIWNNNSKDYRLSFVVQMTGVTISSRRERKITRVTEFTIGTAQRPRGGQS